ncbi:MAG: sulfotransferase [bacterium]|nr:sulfotransferase [bacterium]
MTRPILTERVRRGWQSRQRRRALATVETYCMFIGYQRSGHSLVGSLLDAHDSIVIAHEADALERISEGISREDLYLELWENSWRQARKGRQETGYSYQVPGGRQGSSRGLRVIGDKKGGRSSTILAERPHLLGALRKTLGDHRLRVIHVMRHPLDNIATIHSRAAENPRRGGQTLREAIDVYFGKCDTVARVRKELGEDLLDLRLEQLIAQPAAELERCCIFLGVDPTPTYLEACSAIVYARPNKARTKFEWPPELRDEVLERLSRYDFLQPYSRET